MAITGPVSLWSVICSHNNGPSLTPNWELPAHPGPSGPKKITYNIYTHNLKILYISLLPFWKIKLSKNILKFKNYDIQRKLKKKINIGKMNYILNVIHTNNIKILISYKITKKKEKKKIWKRK